MESVNGDTAMAVVEINGYPPRKHVDYGASGRVIAYTCGKCAKRVETPDGVLLAMTRHVQADGCTGKRLHFVRGGVR